jgi:threonine dehydrogenase-like Zn-dependent dehydrogenase
VVAVSLKKKTIKSGQCHVQRYMKPLLERIERGEIDPAFIVTHQLPLEDAPRGYEIFKHKEDHCIKIVLKPQVPAHGAKMSYAQ